MNIPAPPEEIYSTVPILFDAVQMHARGNGYAVSKLRSKRKNRLLHKVYIKCDWGGVFKSKANPEDRQRKTSTRRIDCPFSVVGMHTTSGWQLTVRNPDHNHSQSLDPAAHSSHRTLTKENKEKIQVMSNATIAPKQIASSLQAENSDIALIAADIYNVKKKIRRENLGFRTPIQALVDELKTTDHTYCHARHNSYLDIHA